MSDVQPPSSPESTQSRPTPPRREPPKKKSSTRLLLWVSAIGLLIAVGGMVSAVMLLDMDTPALDDEPAWIHMKLTGAITDAPGNEGLVMDPADMPPLTTEVAQALRDAATDEKVLGLVLEVRSTGLGWAQLQELRDALLTFAENDKPCIAWSEAWENKEYYLATGCQQIHLAPTGVSMVNGLAITQSYYAGTFEKIGVSANFRHVGAFKSAVEPYERTGPSEAAAEATGALLDSLYGQLVGGIAQGRGLEVERARALVDSLPITPTEAKEQGLVDELSYLDELLDKEPEPVSMGDYLKDRRRAWKGGDSTIAVIYAEGAIVSGTSGQELFGGSFIGAQTLSEQLKDAREDEDVAAVVLRVNSPGGSGSASDAIWRQVALTREEKPVVVSMADYAASGGYYISMGANHIVAQPGTLTGSIGVFGGKLNIHGVYENLGISTHTIQRGQYANIFSSDSDFSERESERFQAFLEEFYTTFVDKAAQGRGKEYDEVHAVAQGRVWTGEQALELGLVDELGGLDTAIAKAVELADLSGDIHLRRIPERKGFLDQLLEEMANPSTTRIDPRMQLTEIRDALSATFVLERVLADGGVAALLPGAPVVR